MNTERLNSLFRIFLVAFLAQWSSLAKADTIGPPILFVRNATDSVVEFEYAIDDSYISAALGAGQVAELRCLSDDCPFLFVHIRVVSNGYGRQIIKEYQQLRGDRVKIMFNGWPRYLDFFQDKN